MLSILGYLRPNADAGLFRCSFATASDGHDDQLSPAERDAAILKGDLLPIPCMSTSSRRNCCVSPTFCCRRIFRIRSQSLV